MNPGLTTKLTIRYKINPMYKDTNLKLCAVILKDSVYALGYSGTVITAGIRPIPPGGLRVLLRRVNNRCTTSEWPPPSKTEQKLMSPLYPFCYCFGSPHAYVLASMCPFCEHAPITLHKGLGSGLLHQLKKSSCFSKMKEIKQKMEANKKESKKYVTEDEDTVLEDTTDLDDTTDSDDSLII